MALEISTKLFSYRSLIILVLFILLLILIPIASSIGLYRVTFLDVVRVSLGHKLPEDEYIALWLRMRRTFVGIIIGALLAGGGVVSQAVFKNPLASPFTLGISHAAALGVAVSLTIGYGGRFYTWFTAISNPYILPFSAFIFASIQSILVLFLAYRAGLSPYALVLSSIAMSFIYQSILAILQYLVLNELQIATIVFWMFGDLSRVGNLELLILAVGFIPITLLYMFMHLDLDLISLSDEVAYASGTNPKRLRFIAMLIAALGTAFAISFVGILAFLCLVAPHIARSIIGNSHRYLIPSSMLIGSILAVGADIVSRVVLFPRTLPIGIVLSFIGTPLLIFLLFRGGGYSYHKGY
ncbi:MAG: iron ABC transporter permease [Ignisphaera sp.]